MAEMVGITQANISRLKSRDDLYLSTLAEFVEALGGQLELSAIFPDEVIVIDIAHAKVPSCSA